MLTDTFILSIVTNQGGRGITKLSFTLILVIVVLLTVSFAEAIPQGTVIKEGVLTYPAGPYLAKDPLLLGLDNYGGNNRAQISGNSTGNSGNLFFETAYSEKDHPHSEKECTYFAKSYNLNLKNLITANIRICLSDPFSI